MPRYYSDFMLMFSPLGEANQAYSRPSLIITDDKVYPPIRPFKAVRSAHSYYVLQARKVWEKNVGKHVYFCSFKVGLSEQRRKPALILFD